MCGPILLKKFDYGKRDSGHCVAFSEAALAITTESVIPRKSLAAVLASFHDRGMAHYDFDVAASPMESISASPSDVTARASCRQQPADGRALLYFDHAIEPFTESAAVHGDIQPDKPHALLGTCQGAYADGERFARRSFNLALKHRWLD